MKDQSYPSRDSGRSDLHLLGACPMCQTAYHPLTTRVIAQRDEANLLYLECRHCGSAVVAMVTAERGGLRSVGAVTDLTRSEVIPTSAEQPITTDDVLDLYDWFVGHASLDHIVRTGQSLL